MSTVPFHPPTYSIGYDFRSLLQNSDSQSGTAHRLAPIWPILTISPVRRSGSVSIDKICCRWFGSMPKSMSKCVSLRMSFVLPERYRTSRPIWPSSTLFIVHRLFHGDESFNWSVSALSPGSGSVPWPGNVSGSYKKQRSTVNITILCMKRT